MKTVYRQNAYIGDQNMDSISWEICNRDVEGLCFIAEKFHKYGDVVTETARRHCNTLERQL